MVQAKNPPKMPDDIAAKLKEVLGKKMNVGDVILPGKHNNNGPSPEEEALQKLLKDAPKKSDAVAITSHNGLSADFYAKACEADIVHWKEVQAEKNLNCYHAMNIPTGTEVLGTCYNQSFAVTTYYVCVPDDGAD